jgi:hypothetical protein
MRTLIASAVAGGLLAVLAGPAMADTSAREIQSAVDGYLNGSQADASLVGGAGSAGYTRGFWIRGGDFDLSINLTLQARFESYNWDKVEPGVTPGAIGGAGAPGGGDLSGFSLPRATVKFSGHAPCSICYYMELEYGHWGRDLVNKTIEGNNGFNNGGPNFLPIGPPARNNLLNGNLGPTQYGATPFDFQSNNFDNTREAWIEWCSCDALKFRMGQIKTPNTRQLMTSPELQQFVDVSLASAFTGHLMPGYTDRNRDHGVMFHGVLGCKGEFSWMLAVTNGDGGDSIRNVLDPRTDDNVAFSGRFNWAFLEPIYYEEGALRQSTCTWYGEVGAWGHYYADRQDGAHVNFGDNLNFGADLALGTGGFSFTAAFTKGKVKDSFVGASDIDSTIFLVQAGYLFPGTAWEVAARFSKVKVEEGAFTGSLQEVAGAINYYLNGHGNKMSLDVSFLSETDADLGFFDAYTGIQPLPGAEDKAMLIRFQWQLAL